MLRRLVAFRVGKGLELETKSRMPPGLGTFIMAKYRRPRRTASHLWALAYALNRDPSEGDNRRQQATTANNRRGSGGRPRKAHCDPAGVRTRFCKVQATSLLQPPKEREKMQQATPPGRITCTESNNRRYIVVQDHPGIKICID